ncbi:phosphatidylserine decarboxylase [Bacillus benzoevorans]|uniref:phosphatidylserine decarboxylase n=1 Tax=Bacillus benzoevorans TaxID=1456 RepID=A0A7X0LWX8_9BACI|nr:phosphatidylserine decarboxylase [Bacillus benzoevorans]MBB6445947.1 phosphatidylserine decarboxylase [Bacillus benzoevorans]
MLQVMYRCFIELTNRKWTSQLLARFSKSEKSRIFIPSFAHVYKINQDEMEMPLSEYRSLHDFFIRNLKQDARKVDQNQAAVVSPVDAVIEDIGMITMDQQIMVKGKSYSISEMLGGLSRAKKYQNGTYMIFYLSPSDYHRIHSPVNGRVAEQWSLGSSSYPVNKYGLKYGKSPLSKNYRTITEVKLADRSLAIVKVGAMFINSIEIQDLGEDLEKGMEMAYFTFGSTVVLLFENGLFEISPAIQIPCAIHVGECIGYIRDENSGL